MDIHDVTEIIDTDAIHEPVRNRSAQTAWGPAIPRLMVVSNVAVLKEDRDRPMLNVRRGRRNRDRYQL